jgi:rfaE bifunctional protein nucleotidyltransferase chain/domain
VTYLEQARAQGDRLIVAVNDDASVSRLKGPGRPINSVDRRMAVLAGLGAVDWVISFPEGTPENLLAKVKPDVLVKGGDYGRPGGRRRHRQGLRRHGESAGAGRKQLDHGDRREDSQALNKARQ